MATQAILPSALTHPDAAQSRARGMRRLHSTANFAAPIGIEYGQSVAYQNIGSMHEHCAFSVEELRLNDYKHNRGKPTESQSFMGQFFLVTAQLQFITQNLRSARLSASAVSDLSGNTITFDVGKDDKKKRFLVHEKTIMSRSKFVRLALDKEWKEAQERTIPLPDDEPAVFKLYQLWCYYTRVFSQDNSNAIYGTSGTEFRLLVQAYNLGDKLLDTHFKDAVLDCIIDTLRSTSKFDVRLTGLVYDNTTERSPLRRLWQDIYIWASNPSWLDEEFVGDFIHAELLLDLGKRHMMFNNGQRPASVPYLQESACGYHEHVEGVCYLQAYR
ncbi:hypothetical protein LTR08_006365 [Meristemomyces frigidus]|nr:hypothetical protein LTR08_006365 [Meristemomyces frigidus]